MRYGKTFKSLQISLRKLIANMRRCLVQDPFQIDDLSVDTPSCAPRRVTSLTNTRRKVTVSGWHRFQLLTKAVYKDVHLRISSNKAESMFIAPWRCRSIIIDNVRSCPAMVLGPTHGVVILREGLPEEMEAANLRATRYSSSRHVINLDDSDVSTLAASDFYIQPVPIVNNDNDVKDLLQKLPPFYRVQWESRVTESKTTLSESTSGLPLKKSDLIYLRGKIVSER
ncbi:hypothetical protein COOONC_07094 [Cooperia oncophora]